MNDIDGRENGMPRFTTHRGVQFAVCLFFILSFFQGCRQRTDYVNLQGLTMGTFYRITLELPVAANQQELNAGVAEELAKLNRMLSPFQTDSEISRFNRAAAGEWVPVSLELARLVATARTVSEKSGGAFDATVAPLLDLWGLGPGRNKMTVPDALQIATAKQRTGYGKLHSRLELPALFKDSDDLQCDLSVIAKGYGVDRLAAYLKSRGVKNFLVEIGGEIACSGLNPVGKNWVVGISRPGLDKDRLQKLMELTDVAVATSGDYRDHLEQSGQNYSHTIDPATGYPVTHNLVSVTIIAANCTVADAMATAIEVLGPERGWKLAGDDQLAVYMIIRNGNVFQEKATPQFLNYVQHKEL